MTDPTICVITPTIGRPTLKRTLESGKLGNNDLWLVMYDELNDFSRQPIAKIIADQYIALEMYHAIFSTASLTNEYGNHARDMMLDWCKNLDLFKRDYLIFLDDDDLFTPGAIEIIKQEIAAHHPRPIMFKMINGNGEILWRNRELTPGNVGGSMFCCPNIPGKLGKWSNGAGHRSDYEFIRETMESYGDGWRQHIVWSDKVIIHCRPNETSEIVS